MLYMVLRCDCSCCSQVLRVFNDPKSMLSSVIDKIRTEQNCLSVESTNSSNRIHKHTFCSSDLDLNPMTLIDELDLDILPAYQRNELARSRLSILQHYRLDTQADATKNITTPHYGWYQQVCREKVFWRASSE